MHQTIDTTTTRAQLAAACHLAKREYPRTNTTGVLTGWDKRHAQINDLLDELEWVET